MNEMGDWSIDEVRQTLGNYAELCEICEAAFACSSWSSTGQSRPGASSYPKRIGLLCQKWDVERAARQLNNFMQLVFHLRYRYNYQQRRISRLLGCSRYRVVQTLATIPEAILAILNEGEMQYGDSGDINRLQDTFVREKG